MCLLSCWGRKADCLVYRYFVLCYFIWPLFYVSLSRWGKENRLLGLFVLVNVLFYMDIVLCVFNLGEERKTDCLVYLYLLLCYFIWPVFYVFFNLAKEMKEGCLVYLYFILCYSIWLFFYVSFIPLRIGKQFAWFIGTSHMLFYMTIVLCVFYLVEIRKADCLVYLYFILCYSIWLFFYVSFIPLRIGWFIGTSHMLFHMTIVLCVLN